MRWAVRSVLLLWLAFFLLAMANGASAENVPANAGADDARKKAALAEAVVACDRGAAMPLDPDAKAPPVQYDELVRSDIGKEKLRMLARKCQEAAQGAAQEKRLMLQWLRVQVALDDPGLIWLIPQIKTYADGGNAEASYLLFQIYHRLRDDGDQTARAIARDGMLPALNAAADAGHLEALDTLFYAHQLGGFRPNLRRDPRKAVETAQRIIDAPPQGEAVSEYDTQIRSSMPSLIAMITLENDNFTADEQRKAFAVADAETRSGTEGLYRAALAYVNALRRGWGISQDAAKARQLLETRAKTDEHSVPMLADMVAKGEGGPADGKRAIAMLRDDRLKYVRDAGRVLAGLLLDGKFVGRQPREAIQQLLRSGHSDLDAKIRAAGLLVDYHVRIEDEQDFINKLSDGAAVGEPGAALALALLKLSDNSRFRDEEGARAVLKPLADQGDRAALWLYASSQYANLDSTGSQPYRREDGLSDEELKALIDDGAEKKEAEAFLLAAKLTRRGVVYPQDDETATKLLINAANLGNVEAMVLLGVAYAEGLGVEKNPRERVHAWREAARLGSLEAKSKLANAFIFDNFEKLLTLREGVTNRIALYNNGIGRRIGSTDAEFAGLFSGGRISDAGTAPVAEAVMDAFREAPAGLEEETLVGIGKALPDEIRAAIEKKLKADGFYAGEPKGYFGPEARKALAAWVDAKGPLSDVAEAPADPPRQVSLGEDVVATDIVDRVRDRAFKLGMVAKTSDERLAAVKLLSTLGRYGDVASRWALVRNYHQGEVVRSVVTPEEITRYALDLLVTRPEGIEKAEFEFIFDLTQIAQDGRSDAVGEAMLAAIRDDSRLQDPLTLGGIMGQFIFAPGACEAVLDAAKRAGVSGLGSDGCEEDTRAALVQFAKAEGPAGIDDAARKAAALEIKSLDGRAKN